MTYQDAIKQALAGSPQRAADAADIVKNRCGGGSINGMLILLDQYIPGYLAMQDTARYATYVQPAALTMTGPLVSALQQIAASVGADVNGLYVLLRGGSSLNFIFWQDCKTSGSLLVTGLEVLGFAAAVVGVAVAAPAVAGAVGGTATATGGAVATAGTAVATEGRKIFDTVVKTGVQAAQEEAAKIASGGSTPAGQTASGTPAADQAAGQVTAGSFSPKLAGGVLAVVVGIAVAAELGKRTKPRRSA